MSEELEPCPFCGCTPRLHKPNRTAYAWCESCRTSPWKLADWNRRARSARVEELEGLLREARPCLRDAGDLWSRIDAALNGGRDGS